jgi:hypothetical protein
MRKPFLIAAFLLLFAVSSFTQNKFEGANLILDATDKQTEMACGLRFVPPTTNITITDLNPATQMKLSSCGDATSSLSVSGTSANIKASTQDYKWCFTGEDKMYRISFNGDRYSGPVTYNWIATPDERTRGFYNIKDFGAAGDGRADDTLPIKSALAYIASRNGGVLTFPEGDYRVTAAITLPSNITIQGVGGVHTGAITNTLKKSSASRIVLDSPKEALFRIGECTEKIVIRDIELYANSTDETIGIHARGAFITSQDFYFQRVSFSNFYRGIYAHGLKVTDLNWQFDYIKIDHCRFVHNTDAGIYVNTRNTDWKIIGSVFFNAKNTPTQKGDSMRFERTSAVMIQDTFSGGYPNALGGTFISILDGGVVTVIGSQCESMKKSLTYNEEQNPYAGDYSYPITFVNNVFGSPIEFYARRTFVSTGNLYTPNVFKADERLRVYSMGDRFCYDGYIWGCRDGVTNLAAPKGTFDRATVIFMTGQPSEGNVTGHPAQFGTDVHFNSPIQLPSFQQNVLPAGKANGSMVYCANCKRNTAPCQSGGGGAPAMVVNGQWSCL